MRKIKTIIKRSSSVALVSVMILGSSGMMAYAASGEFTGEKVQTINTDVLSATAQANKSASTVSGQAVGRALGKGEVFFGFAWHSVPPSIF